MGSYEEKSVLYKAAVGFSIGATVFLMIALAPIPALVIALVVLIVLCVAALAMLLFSLFALFDQVKAMFQFIQSMAEAIGQLAVFTVRYIAPVASGIAAALGIAGLTCAILFNRRQNGLIAAGLLDPNGIMPEPAEPQRHNPKNTRHKPRPMRPIKPPMGKPQIALSAVTAVLGAIVFLLVVVPGSKEALINMFVGLTQ